jgi:hypothetical protein
MLCPSSDGDGDVTTDNCASITKNREKLKPHFCQPPSMGLGLLTVSLARILLA